MNRASTITLFSALVATALSSGALVGAGLWDPVEIEPIARLLAEGEATRPLDRLFVGALAFGEEKIRWISLLFGFFTLALTFGTTAFLSDRRSALYALILLSSTPLFLLNARLGIGAMPAIFAQHLSAFAFYLALAPQRDGRATLKSLKTSLPLVALSAWISVSIAGVLLGLLPGLIAALISRSPWIEGRGAGALRNPVYVGAIALTLVLSAFLLRAIFQDSPEFSLWLGGGAMGDPPPAFHRLVERAFHGLLPISAFVPALIGFALFGADRPNDGRDEEGGLSKEERDAARFMCLLGAASYLSATIYEARYGVTTFVAAPAVAIAGAIALRDLERRPAPGHGVDGGNGGEKGRLIALSGLLLLGLGLRDLFLFPESFIGSLPLRAEALPEGLSETIGGGPTQKLLLGLPLIAFGVLASIIIGGNFSAGPTRDRRASGEEDPRPRFRLLASPRGRRWLALGLIAYFLVAIAGLLHTLIPTALPFRSIVGLVASVTALALPLALVACAALLALHRLIARVPNQRGGLLAFGALPFGLCIAFLVLPNLDAQLSPKETLALLEEVHDGSAPIYALDQNAKALSAYTALEIEPDPAMASLHRALAGKDRLYLLFPRARLAELNREIWSRTRRHLEVLSDANPNTILATNLPIEGRKNRNPLAPLILDERPEIEHPVKARFRGGYELLGYAIESPRGALEAGRKFTVRLYWTTSRRDTRNYEIFVHLDGPTGRMHGDHPPLRGLYETRYWGPGDFLVDEREIRVPGHFAPGKYTLHVGLYRGKERVEVFEGPKDENDRVIAGEVELR